MKDLDEENFDDSDSEYEDEFENSIFENNEVDLDVSANFDEKVESLFSWKEVEGSEAINVLPFSGKVGLKFDASNFKTENDFFKLMFTDEILSILVEETNRYAFDVLNLHGETSDKRNHVSSWKPTNKNEILKFLGLILLMGHIEKDSIQDYWTTNYLVETPFFREVMPRDRFLMILKFLHFSDNSLKESRDSPTYDRLWKIRKIFDNFNRTFKEVYDPTENVSFDEVIIKFKGRIHFKQYIPKKRKQWGLKMYKIADATGYTYDMRVYLGKDKKENLSTSATYNVVNAMTDCIKGKGHKVFMDSFFSSPELYRDLLKEKKINSCGTVRPNRKHFPKNLAPCKMKQGDLAVKFCNGMTAMCWKDKRQVYMLTNMHSPRNEFIIDERKRFLKKIDGDVSESEKDRLSTTKPKIVADYNKHMGYVYLGDRMASTYTFARRTRKWTKKLFFSLIDIAVLNAFLLLKSCQTSSKFSLKEFRMNLITSLIGKINHKNVEPSVTKKLRQMIIHFLIGHLTKRKEEDALIVRKKIYKKGPLLSGNNIFQFLSPEDYRSIISIVESAILSTDLALYFKKKDSFLNLVKSGDPDWKNPHNRELLRGMMMTACDVSAICKPGKYKEKWLNLLLGEFFQQGDLEKERLKEQPIAMMDREKKDELPAMQVGFIDCICLPVYEVCILGLLIYCLALAEVQPALNPLLQGCLENRKNWQALANDKHRKESELFTFRNGTNKKTENNRQLNGMVHLPQTTPSELLKTEEKLHGEVKRKKYFSNHARFKRTNKEHHSGNLCTVL
ncbi:piggyBac transposable element-derived protein 4 [Trichonephila clavata]|uniref:PiggyBac transposable element-derived protein 4 n=2 Tax=Trichonephila clavata TaxID=2740835 RepID=A0A8X6FXT3_TRICU|nr:piggyBac transposable element-derived protein 4 [Trichonephila clavata]